MIFDRLQHTLLFWWRNLFPLLIVIVPFAVLSSLAELAFGPLLIVENNQISDVGGLSVVAVMLIQVCAEGALICQLASLQKDGRARNLLDCVLFGGYLLPKLALCIFLTTIPLAGGALMAVALSSGPAGIIGLVFLVIGLLGFIRLSLAPFYVALDSLPIKVALQRSMARTQPEQFPLLTSWLLLMFVILMTAGVFEEGMLAIVGENGVSAMLTTIVQKALGVVATVLLFLTYAVPVRPTQS
ncbi:MAG: hypothetical protein P1U67_14460 [Alcanivoracaceae bacterium]|nr:hypothetical protein [Alcanivoracaceae bacterium]